MSGPPGLISTGPFAGRYTIERYLGHGATATVHLARDTERGVAVAIKILRPELAQSKASDRFLKEIRRTSELQHSHILSVLDSGEHAGRLYFVLPYMEGGTLRARLRGGTQLPFEETIAILRTIAGALDYAHARGLIHRDVKPENILFTNGEACLGDFGIARVIETIYGTDGTTSADTIRGTYAYMSPEQAAGGTALDGRSDIYSLACVAYEMITGMQAFIGPTAESVVAQRFVYQPREVRVYRPSAPPTVDEALLKAFAMSPADRYKTATEFVDALAIAAEDSPSFGKKRRSAAKEQPAAKWRPRTVALGVAGLVLSVAAIVWGTTTIVGPPDQPVPIDTTRLVVLPLERDTLNQRPWSDDDLLQQGLSRYRDFVLIDQYLVADALRRRKSTRSPSDAGKLAASLGAGRFIMGGVSRYGDRWQVSASIYDAPAGKPLYPAREVMTVDINSAVAAYARIADSLLLRGAPADSNSSSASGSRSLPAVQAFGRAQVALAEWDLMRADSALQAVINYDPDYARAHYLLAQVRAWRNPNSNAWGTIAERAVAISGQLNDRENNLAHALVYLGRASYDSACAVYSHMAQRSERDFAAWFGLGQCRTLNKTVVRDPKSPSGWRFVASAHTAMRAYSKAFEILPSVYRGFERGAFQRLQTILLTTGLIAGYSLPDSARFYGQTGWMGDTLVVVPYPADVWVKGGPNPPGHARAVAERQAEFKRIALSWSAAYPNSAGAKEVVAMTLDRLGDQSAIDTLRNARALSVDANQRTRFAATEVQLLAKFGTPVRRDLLHRAHALGDSLLIASANPSAEQAAALVPVAVLLGRCRTAEDLVVRAGMDGRRVFSAGLYFAAQKLLIRTTIGCVGGPGAMSIRELMAAIDQEAANQGSEGRTVFDGWLLLRPAIQSQAYDAEALERVVASTGYPQAKAALHGLREEFARGRTVLDSVESTWARLPTPDFALATARAWLTLRDTVAAARVLDLMIDGVSTNEPSWYFYDGGTTSAFLAGVILRGDIAAAKKDIPSQQRAASVIDELWRTADDDLKPVVARMSKYASAR